MQPVKYQRVSRAMQKYLALQLVGISVEKHESVYFSEHINITWGKCLYLIFFSFLFVVVVVRFFCLFSASYFIQFWWWQGCIYTTLTSIDQLEIPIARNNPSTKWTLRGAITPILFWTGIVVTPFFFPCQSLCSISKIICQLYDRCKLHSSIGSSQTYPIKLVLKWYLPILFFFLFSIPFIFQRSSV